MFGKVPEVRVGEDDEVQPELIAEEIVGTISGKRSIREVIGQHVYRLGGVIVLGGLIVARSSIFERFQVQLPSPRQQPFVAHDAAAFRDHWNCPSPASADQPQQPFRTRQRLRTGGVDVAILQAADRKGHQLPVAQAHRAGVQIGSPRFRPEQDLDEIGIAADGLEAMPHRALDARAGETGVIGVAFALDRAVDDPGRGPGAHVYRAHRVQEHDGLVLEHRFVPLRQYVANVMRLNPSARLDTFSTGSDHNPRAARLRSASTVASSSSSQ